MTLFLSLGGVARADEIGPNDFRISHMGTTDGDINYAGFFSAVAYNSQNNQFFVVWTGDDDTVPLVNDEMEVFGQRIDSATGALVGSRVRLSDMGTNGLTAPGLFGAPPAVAYNSQNNEYLVVWSGDDITGSLADNEYEIYGQRVNAATGAEVGVNDFRISGMGADGDAFKAINPSVAYDSADNTYLVVWQGQEPALIAGTIEIYGRRIKGDDGTFLGSQAILRAPDMVHETVGNVLDRTGLPDVAYNATDNEYLVVFQGDIFSDDNIDIFGQRVNASTGVPIGVEFRVSDMGGSPFAGFNARVVHNPMKDEYLVVWVGDHIVNNENEVYGQRVDGATGAEVGTNDFRITHMGPDGNTLFGASMTDVAYNSKNKEYIVVWDADDNQGGQVDDERETFVQRLDADTGALIGTYTRITDMAGIGTTSGEGVRPMVAYDSADQSYLVVFDGEDDILPLTLNDHEVFGQLLTDLKCGNGVTEASEACDDGNADNTDACLNTCVAASCGDGFVQAGVEECDGTADCGTDCKLIPADSTGGTPAGGGAGTGATDGTGDGTANGATDGTDAGSGDTVDQAPGGCSLVR